MNQSIKISIPTPCHENWEGMTPTDKGRFCAACQKKVTDFTFATDREIYAAYKRDGNLCGRFISTQLNRELAFRENKKTGWGIAALAFMGFMTAGSKAFAQKTVYNKPKVTAVAHKKTAKAKPFTIGGTVTDTACVPLANVYVGIKGTGISTVTDSTGYFKLPVKKGDIVVCDMVGYIALQQTVSDKDNMAFTLNEDMGVAVVGYGYTQKVTIMGGAIVGITVDKRRSFFGRIIYTITKPFRKHE